LLEDMISTEQIGRQGIVEARPDGNLFLPS